LRQGLVVVFDQGLYSITNFVTGVLLARTLIKEEYGSYVLALSLIVMIMGVQRAVISVPYTVYSPKYNQEVLQRYSGSVFIHQIILLIVAIVICSFVSGIFIAKQSINANNFTVITSSFIIIVIGVLLRDFVRSFLLARLNIGASLLMGTFINCLQIICLALFYMKNELTLCTVFLIIGICSFLPVLVFFIRFVKIAINIKHISVDFVNNFRIGKWIFGCNTLYNLSSQSYAWMLSMFVDNSSVAVLGVTMSLANILGPILQGINSFILPKMSHSKKDSANSGIVKIMNKSIIVLTIIFTLWLFCGILFGDYLLNLIYSSRYSGYGNILIIAILSSFVAGITGPLNSTLDALERPDISFKSLIGGLIVTISIGAFLVYRWGIYGAVTGILLSNATNCGLRWRGMFMLIRSYRADENKIELIS